MNNNNMQTNSTGLKRKPYSFKFHSLRNISCPEDTQNDRKVYSGQAPVSSILNLPTNENVRDYLVEAEGKLRRSYTSVHKAIKETLIERPEIFSVLNSGIVIVVHDVEIDEKEKEIKLFKPSIINGSQTQGVLNDLADQNRLPFPEVHIKFEIIVTADVDLVAETSIARNYQNDVMSISIAGRRNQFDELELSFRKTFPDVKLRKSESQVPNDEIVDTEKLLQVIAALIPNELWYRSTEDSPNKVYTYSMKARCLKEYQEIYKKAHNEKEEEQGKYKELYQFYLDISATAFQLYKKWKSHQGFAGTGLINGILRDDKKRIVEIADGIIFPIISSLAVFAKKNAQRVWEINLPSILDETELIQAAKTAMTEMASHNPQTMGKTKACYSALLQITSIYKKFMPKN
jgi:predicted ester cyclase